MHGLEAPLDCLYAWVDVLSWDFVWPCNRCQCIVLNTLEIDKAHALMLAVGRPWFFDVALFFFDVACCGGGGGSKATLGLEPVIRACESTSGAIRPQAPSWGESKVIYC